MLVDLKTRFSAVQIAEILEADGVAVIPIGEGDNRAKIMLNCANVAMKDYEQAVEELKKSLEM